MIHTLLNKSWARLFLLGKHHSVFHLRYSQYSIRSYVVNSNKFVTSATEALSSCIFPGAVVACGGFGLGGIPETLLNELSKDHFCDAKDLTIVSLNAGSDGFGLGKLYESGKVKRVKVSYVGENKYLERMYFGGKIEVELIPQGTLAAKLKNAGAGIPAFYTPTGAGTVYAKGGIPIKFASDGSGGVEIESQPRETRVFNGREYVMEDAIHADVSLVKAWKADRRGNLVFRGTSRNSNPDVAMAGRVTIVEAEEIVETGSIHPDEVHLSGIYVDKLILATDDEKRIERLKTRTLNDCTMDACKDGRERIMRRVAKELQDGMYVNLGIGIPTMASNYIPSNIRVDLESENGLLGAGPYPDRSLGQKPDPDWINAGKETITALPGSCTFSSSSSFDLIRGGHLDLTVLGALQVSSNGDIASWVVPGSKFKGMGGSMDLVCSGTRVVVTMDHIMKDGTHKILKECSYPLTGRRVVDRIITDMAVFDCDKSGDGGLTLLEIAEGFTVDDITKATGCSFNVAKTLKVINCDAKD